MPFGLLALRGMQNNVLAIRTWARIVSGVSSDRAFVMLAKWFSSTRLETRTKESNIYASIRVLNPHAKWKWRHLLALAKVGNRAFVCLVALSTDHHFVKGLSLSITVGTRKMVIYAWTGWSQGKLWWRLVAILTCKSFVWFGYRGERLIEPSSSWFPPKFPSG